MRATIKNYIDGAKKRREEGDDKGFSLIELIVVVAILGILVAIAIPVFGAIQDNAKENAVKTVAANAATSAAAQIANGEAGADWGDLEASLTDTDVVVTIDGDSLESICATATGRANLDGKDAESGPGC